MIPKLVTCLTITGLLIYTLGVPPLTAAGQSPSHAPAAQDSHGPAHRVLFNRYQAPEIAIFIANADGDNAHPLVVGHDRTYSPSFAADGEWIVFTAETSGQSDLYRVHPDGTGLEQLTSHPAFDDQGALSPDGRRVAFVSTRAQGTADLWVKDLVSGLERNLTDHSSGNFRPSWSPDGAWIAFTSDRDADPGYNPGMWEHLQSTGVYIIRPDGSDLRRLTRQGGVAGSPSWSPDGDQILFYETDEVGAYLAKSARSRTEIASVDVTTGTRTTYTASNETKLSPSWLSNGRIGYASRADGERGGLRVRHANRRVDTIIAGPLRNPSWSPDGSQVVYERIARLGSVQHMTPTFSPDPDFELYLHEPFVSFSPDGEQLVYSQTGLRLSDATGIEQTDIMNTSIDLMEIDGAGATTIFHEEGASAFAPVWSHAADEIAFSVGRYFRRPGLPPGQIAVVGTDGSGLRFIVDDEVNNGFPSWSPDGTRLVFKRGRQLVVTTLADGTLSPLTEGNHYDNFPQWSLDGSQILFTSNRDDDFDLYTIRPDGSALRRVTDATGVDGHGSWCGENWILFSSARMGFKDEMALYDAVPQPYGEIFAIRADGSDTRQLTDNKWEDSGAVCQPSH